MKICFLRHGYFPACQRVRKETSALTENGFSIDVLCLRKPGEKLFERRGNLRIFRIPLGHKREGIVRYVSEYFASFLFFNAYLLLLFCINRYHVIQVNTMPDLLIFTTILPKLFGSKIVMDIHEPTPELWETKYGEKKSTLYRFQKTVHRQAISYATHCISVTEKHSKYLQELFGIRSGKFTVVENVCDSFYESFARNYPNCRKPDASFNMIIHGAIEKRYGHEIAIQAIDHLKNEIPAIKLYITGNGAYETNLKRMVNELCLNDSVKFLGFVPKKILLQSIMEADVGLVTMQKSPYSELIETNKMYEYMAMQKPIIISRLEHLARKFGDSCFQFFTPGDFHDFARCVRELYYDETRRIELSLNAFNEYKKLEWEKTKTLYVNTIRGLASISHHSWDDNKWSNNEQFQNSKNLNYNHLL